MAAVEALVKTTPKEKFRFCWQLFDNNKDDKVDKGEMWLILECFSKIYTKNDVDPLLLSKFVEFMVDKLQEKKEIKEEEEKKRRSSSIGSLFVKDDDSNTENSSTNHNNDSEINVIYQELPGNTSSTEDLKVIENSFSISKNTKLNDLNDNIVLPYNEVVEIIIDVPLFFEFCR